MTGFYGDMLNLGAGVPFLRSQARILMKDKYVLFLGDSVQECGLTFLKLFYDFSNIQIIKYSH